VYKVPAVIGVPNAADQIPMTPSMNGYKRGLTALVDSRLNRTVDNQVREHADVRADGWLRGCSARARRGCFECVRGFANRKRAQIHSTMGLKWMRYARRSLGFRCLDPLENA
jgi:hypothetical protein